MVCEYCRRISTRFYNAKGLCELHYLKENPERNRRNVDWDKLKRMRMVTDDILFISKQEKLYLQEG